MLKLPRLTLPTLKLPPLLPSKGVEQSPAVPPPSQVKPLSFRLSVAPSASKMLRVGHGADGSRFELEHQSGIREAIFAQSGMGKSYLTGVLLEQTLECGGLVYVVDPEGEYHTLKQRYPVLVVGGDDASIGLDLEAATAEDFQRLSETVLMEGVSVVLDLSDFDGQRQQEIFILAAGSLFNAQGRDDLKRPIKMVVEEADVFAPQHAAGLKSIDGETSLSIAAKLAKRGRKRGADLLTATQRPATLSKNVVTQANRLWFGGINAEQDYKALKPHLEQHGITSEQLKALTPGQFYCCQTGKPPVLVKVGKRKCQHVGSTPPVGNKPVASRERLKEIAAKL